MIGPDDFDGHYVEDTEDAKSGVAGTQTLQVIAEQWVRGREIDLLGARVARAVENSIDTGYLSRTDWADDPMAWAEELQLYAADTLEAIPISTLVGLIEGYAAEILAL